MKKAKARRETSESVGKLRIGDHWNAISIIALSQSNPLKAVAEFVENSIDAGAHKITITRGKEQGTPYLRIVDDGDGIPKDENGLPNFKHVATHICDSIKRRLKAQGAEGIQGEFGIGLLSFWTVGEELTLTSSGDDGKTYQMLMRKGDPDYSVRRTRALFPGRGTELKVRPLLTGIRRLSGEKIQWYLASELRDRIRKSDVQIQINDRTARVELSVEPREFTGRLLHELPAVATPLGDIYTEVYLAEPSADNQIGLYRGGTRVLERITDLDAFSQFPWTSGYLQGLIDVPFLNLTPATRSAIVQDDAFAGFCESIQPVQESLNEIVEQQRRAEEERINRQTLRSIQKAFKEALLTLPQEEYDWFEVRGKGGPRRGKRPSPEEGLPLTQGSVTAESDDASDSATRQKELFECFGPLFDVRVSPASSVVTIGDSRNLRAIPRDRSHRPVEDDLTFHWEIVEGAGALENSDEDKTTFTTPEEPCLTRVRVTVSQGEVVCTGEALVTVTDSLVPRKDPSSNQQGLPGYTYQKAPGELWRSKYDNDRNVIVVNNGHRDFVYSSRTKALKLRYVCRLFAKELVCKNFPGYSPDQLLERMIELSLYTEEHLR